MFNTIAGIIIKTLCIYDSVWFLQVDKLKQAAMEALKSKEDTETKCQQKISDMVALMERHKVLIIVYVVYFGPFAVLLIFSFT